jgi:hypothetical protein
MTPQQQTMARMAALQNQQQNQQMMQTQNLNMVGLAPQSTPQMLPGQQHQQQINLQSGVMAQGNQPVQQQMSMMKQLENPHQQCMIPNR